MRHSSKAIKDEYNRVNMVEDALMFGHLYLLQALHTINDCFELGFEEGISDAERGWEEIWKSSSRASMVE